jgi:hypothetical protein
VTKVGIGREENGLFIYGQTSERGEKEVWELETD